MNYELFSWFYDASLERLYRDSRVRALEAVGFAPGGRVLDLACGTGQNFAPLTEALGPDGRIVGIDLSEGMLGVARKRVEREGWSHVELVHGNAIEADLTEIDGVFCALGFSVFDDWERVLDRICQSVPRGTVIGIFDVYCHRWNPQSTMVEFMAGADLKREISAALEARTDAFVHTVLPGSPWVHGGELFVARGVTR